MRKSGSDASGAERLWAARSHTRAIGAALLGLLVSGMARAQTQSRPAWMDAPPSSTGIAVGQKIPAFRGTDQNGRTQDFNSIRGPKGAVIMFNRSADW